MKTLKTKEFWITILAALLILLFLYTAMSKLFDFQGFKGAMSNQPLPEWMKPILLRTLPEVEIVVSLLLMFDRTRTAGFYASAILMFSFTTYVALGLAHAFSYLPCTCGGVFKSMTWQTHLQVNILFLFFSVMGIWLSRKNRFSTTAPTSTETSKFLNA